MIDADNRMRLRPGRSQQGEPATRRCAAGRWYAAKIVAAMSEDCGACTPACRRHGQPGGRGGGRSARHRRRQPGENEPRSLIGYRFAKAVLANDPET
jgi:hypothetical protein